MTTTLAAIRDRVKAVMEAATPSCAPAQDLFRYRPNRMQMLEEWVANNPATCFRIFDIRRIGPATESENMLDPSSSGEVQRQEPLRILVAYPRLPDLYGESYEAMEDCIRADAHQIRDLVVSGSTYASVSGWAGVREVIIEEPTREGDVWLQSLTFTALYCEASNLT